MYSRVGHTFKGGFCLGLVLFLLMPGVTRGNPSKVGSPETASPLTIHNDKITGLIDGEPLYKVLAQLAQRFGFKLHFQESQGIDVVSAQLWEAPLEEALRKLLNGKDYAMVKSRSSQNDRSLGSGLVMLFVLSADRGTAWQNHSSLDPGPTIELNKPVEHSVDSGNDADPEKIRAIAEDLLVSADPNEREAGVELLGELYSPEVGNLLRQALGQDPDAFVRERAAKALGDIWDPQHIDALADALLKDPDVDVRKSAALAMGEIGAPEAISALQRGLDDRNPEVRESAVQALGDFADSQAISLLRGALADPNAEVRRSAAFHLESLKGVEN
ncbi:MAG: HEAT repeat domain-containing protein [Nitrospirales bacterium]|nr:HEAT repeat domain-containing protein [Nitrospirales bacterium]